ncbi:protease modulator HflK [Tautonia plasticadhaerens]|uniref:Modulator of FtsH protease HflK n=1 Tax=Tautonia plasticadhaerens TaxID=2527974 RepID=A0A518GX41_9BACT|nr:protease modulator HflK [Tautonia plasticadhaerens]QDV33159.1 Modulator of FtsH protease HflK [Tautonia plasticadhaerens]
MSRFARAVLGLSIAGAAAALATGFVAVEPGEAVVVRRLGRADPGPLGPGLHWVAPLGIDRVDRVRTDEVRRLVVGLATVPGAGQAPGAGEFLTGDLNLIRAEAVVQYRVSDPVAFVLAADRLDATILGLGESALSRALSRLGIDEAMRAGRVTVAEEMATDLADKSDRLGLGLAILGVSLTDARPPDEVRPDFAAAQSARSEAETRIRAARGHADRVLLAAESEADAEVERAHAVADRAVSLAGAKADGFRAILDELRRSRPLSVSRLYRDALREVLPGVGRTIVLEPDEPLDLSILGPSIEPVGRPTPDQDGPPDPR